MKKLINGIVFDPESTDWLLIAEDVKDEEGDFRMIWKYVGDKVGIEYVLHTKIPLETDVPVPPLETLSGINGLNNLDNLINNWRGTVYWEQFI